MQPIDFVMPWVDGDDPTWQSEKLRVVPTDDDSCDARAERFRDWRTLRYWFRGIEAFTPWVRKVHFITWGHLPQWLNVDHPKLNIVRHQDYIPQKYLPTFNSHTIELNLHRIRGLCEQFVYWNDDVFPLHPLRQEDFFRNSLPCDSALMNPANTTDLADANGDGRIFYPPYNCVQHLNLHYSLRQCIKRHPLKWFNPRYGSYLLRNLLLIPWPRFVGFVDLHLAQPYLKLSFEEAWEDSEEILDKSCAHKVRSDHDINQWYIRYRQLAEGRFSPISPRDHACYRLTAENDEVFRVITQQKKPLVCLNDGPGAAACFKEQRTRLLCALEAVLPERSSFEKS